MNDAVEFITRIFTHELYRYLAWAAVGMVVGTLLGVILPKVAGRLAIVPRTAGGAVGIATAPFVHANFAHFAANLPPFLVLGGLVLRRHEERFLQITLLIALGQGVLLWLFGRKAAHLGMSGVVFGFFGWLLVLAWFTREISDLAVSAVVLIAYGGMLAGVAPARNGTSWEGHLFGLIAGVGTAWFLDGG